VRLDGYAVRFERHKAGKKCLTKQKRTSAAEAALQDGDGCGTAEACSVP
jgi:hypothetical protein